MSGQGYRERDSRERDYRHPEREPRDFRGRERDPRDRGRDGRDGREMRDQRMDYPLPEEGINIQAWQHAMMRHIVAWAWKDMLLPMLEEDHLLGSASHFYFPSVSSIHLI